MASGRQEFAMVGYAEDLEKMPLKFVQPIPAARICSACGNIPKLTYYLLCGHTLCEPCYESCATTAECVCPLDGDVCVANDVTSKEYPAENLLRRKVHCWNETNGCGVVLPASMLAQHVRHECQHHVTRCPTCSAVVLSRDVCAHLRSECTALVLHAASEPQQGADNSERAHLIAFEKKIEQRVAELDAKLAQLALESGSQSDKQVEICHNINHLKETLTEQLRTASVQTLDRLERNKAEIKALVASEKTMEQRVGKIDTKLAQLSLESGSQSEKLVELCHSVNHLKEAVTEQFGPASDRKVAEMKSLYSKQGESLMAAISSVLASVPNDPKTHQWLLAGYAALKKKALKDGYCWSMCEKVYIRRYLISWGIHFEKEGDSVCLFLCIQLHKGKEDDFIDWPFSKEIKLCIIDPDTRQELLIGGEPRLSEATKRFFSRPIRDSNRPVRVSAIKVESSDIERDGYVKKDQLLVKLELPS